MDNQKAFCRWLDLIVAIAGDREQSVDELAKILGSSRRNVYYVLKALKDYGFELRHAHSMYTLDANSPFFQEISRSVNFTYEQAQYLYNTLYNVNRDEAMSGLLRRKLQRFYCLNENVENTRLLPSVQRQHAFLQRAIRNKRTVVLHDYASSNSMSVSDRVVEPFMFLDGENDVRAYEIKTGKNKTFKLARIGRVETLDVNWAYEDRHRKMFTDMFLFSGDERHHIKLRLDVVAHNLMVEEYPHSIIRIKPEDEGHWILETDVANYIGIGRFILGLYDNIEILSDDGLRDYLQKKIRDMLSPQRRA